MVLTELLLLEEVLCARATKASVKAEQGMFDSDSIWIINKKKKKEKKKKQKKKFDAMIALIKIKDKVRACFIFCMKMTLIEFSEKVPPLTTMSELSFLSYKLNLYGRMCRSIFIIIIISIISIIITQAMLR